jgi:predicted glycoside hydrolase/deacetylase ChbG (UPF0249 family)
MQVDIHIDDLGLYDADLSGLAEAHRSGCLQGVSIVATGRAFNAACAFLRRYPGIECAVHLNLLEGRALSSRESIPLLVDRTGVFRHTFMSLWSFHQSEYELRAELVRQIAREASVQIHRIRQCCGLEHVCLDSHRYAHLLPFVWPVLLKNAGELGISGVRIVNEPSVVPRRLGAAAMDLLSLNPVKRLLLNHLSARLIPVLRKTELVHADDSIGVSCSGRMDTETVRRGLQRVRARSRVPDPRVEIVFHPLRAVSSDNGGDPTNRRYWRFYTSNQRTVEMDTLASSEFQDLIAAYRGQARPGLRQEVAR